MEKPSSRYHKEILMAIKLSDPSQNPPSNIYPIGFNKEGHTENALIESFCASLIL